MVIISIIIYLVWSFLSVSARFITFSISKLSIFKKAKFFYLLRE